MSGNNEPPPTPAAEAAAAPAGTSSRLPQSAWNDDQATVASHDTYRSNRSYGSRKSRGYPTGTDSSERGRRGD